MILISMNADLLVLWVHVGLLVVRSYGHKYYYHYQQNMTPENYKIHSNKIKLVHPW